MNFIAKNLLGTGLIFLAACTAASPTPAEFVIDQDEIATLVMGTMAALESATASEVATSTPIPDRIPQSLYFLSNDSGSEQVWRLEKDGSRKKQMSFLDSAVLEFDVSPLNGSLAIASKDQLIVESELIDGGRLILTSEISQDADLELLAGSNFASPRFSPNGRLLAFSHQGLKILNLDDGEITVLIDNTYEEQDSGSLSERELYFPVSWAPNGQTLLITIASAEGGKLAFANTLSGEIIEFQSSGIVCCQSVWSAQSNFVLVASPFLGLIDSGLWKYSALNGEEEVLIESSGDDATLNFSGWPYLANDGELTFFYSSTAGIPEGDVPLFMVCGHIENLENPETLREDSFLIQEALWSMDGSLAIVLPILQAKAGPLIIAHRDGRPLEILIDNASMLHWGP